eukprot:7584-Heterococcus_DN1.PRE.1
MHSAMRAVLYFGLLLPYVDSNAGCSLLNYCSGHGKCSIYKTCICEHGWGAPDELLIASNIARDCSQRTCPTGKAWGDLPQTAVLGHNMEV